MLSLSCNWRASRLAARILTCRLSLQARWRQGLAPLPARRAAARPRASAPPAARAPSAPLRPQSAQRRTRQAAAVLMGCCARCWRCCQAASTRHSCCGAWRACCARFAGSWAHCMRRRSSCSCLWVSRSERVAAAASAWSVFVWQAGAAQCLASLRLPAGLPSAGLPPQ